VARILVARDGEQASTLVEAKPHRWALSAGARGFRRLARRWVVQRHVDRFCQPFSIEGAEHFTEIDRSAVIIANHTSHFDTMIMLSLLPPALFDRTAVVAAADRFYTNPFKGALYSLRYNAFPITRGGGRNALSYSQQLLQEGWSLLIFPEGTRSRTGELQPFHPGPAILALAQGVPIVPVHIAGAAAILPPGTRWSRPASVRARVGRPLMLDTGMSAMEATSAMQDAMRSLAAEQEVAPVIAS